MSNVVSLAINEYVNQKGKTLSQLAYYLETSKGHLSEIRHNKKNPSLDLGLKILNYTHATEEIKKTWVETSTKLISRNYESLSQTENESRKKTHLKSQISSILAENISLLNIFLDLSASTENGVSHAKILREYGQECLCDLMELVTLDIVNLKEQCFYLSEDTRLVFDRQSSYELMRTVFRRLKNKDKLNEKIGKFQFELDDISPLGIQALEEIHLLAMKQAAEVFKRYELKKSQGGKRYIFQMLVGKV